MCQVQQGKSRNTLHSVCFWVTLLTQEPLEHDIIVADDLLVLETLDLLVRSGTVPCENVTSPPHPLAPPPLDVLLRHAPLLQPLKGEGALMSVRPGNQDLR